MAQGRNKMSRIRKRDFFSLAIGMLIATISCHVFHTSLNDISDDIRRTWSPMMQTADNHTEESLITIKKTDLHNFKKDVCQTLVESFFTDSSPPNPFEDTFAQVFRQLHPQVLNHTLSRILEQIVPSSRSRPDSNEIIDDVSEISRLWHPDRIRQSTLHPLRGGLRKEIFEIIERRIADPDKNPPLEIIVLGGSITLGTGSGQNAKWKMKGNDSLSRWSTQLQEMFQKFFGSDVIRVTNMAMGGMTTDVSTLPLRYGLFPIKPDLIIASFGYNDMIILSQQYKNPFLFALKETAQYSYLLNSTQKLIRAAYAQCNKGMTHLPNVMLVDDSFMIDDKTARGNLMHSRMISEVSQWYDLWSVSWTNAFLHMSYADEKLMSVNATFWPLWGGPNQQAHPHILYHIGIAWMIFYQFAQAAVHGCSSTSNSVPLFPEPNLQNIPPLTFSTRYQDLPMAWKTATAQWSERCDLHDKILQNTTITTEHNSTSNVASSTALCPYAWIANRATNIQTREDVRQVVDSVMIENKGWNEEGNPVKKPRPGWVTYMPGAKFKIRAPVAQRFTLIYMKSYGAKWQDSKLQIKFSLCRPNPLYPRRQICEKNVIQDELAGFHAQNISVNYEASWILPGVNENHTHADIQFQLIGGNTFRINGMLFCRV